MSEESPQILPEDQQIAPEPQSYPYRYSAEQLPVPGNIELTEMERTPEGYFEIEWQYRDVQRALALDFNNHAATMPRGQLEASIKDRIEHINEAREAVAAEPVNIRDTDETFLRRLANLKAFHEEDTMLNRVLARPIWQQYLPADDSEEALTQWDRFKAQYPEHMQINLDELRTLDGKMRALSHDEALQATVSEVRAERIETMRAASAFMGADRKIDGLTRRVAEIYRAAGVSNRSLTRAEQQHVDHLREQSAHIRSERGRLITTPAMLEDVKDELKRRTNIERRRDFEKGLVLTEQMKGIIDELLPSLAQGKPALLVGDTGGAKTALAEYISHQYFGVEPEFISGYGDVNSYQLMGKMSLKSDDGASISEFVPGPVIRAMEAGKPLILDEINAMPPEFLKRLNKIVQLRPGDTFTIQEDSGREVEVRPGFVIIGTANEKSKRYKGVEDLSVEFQNRFGVNVVRVHYPDHDVVYGQPPVENAIIARAALTDRAGAMTGNINPTELEQFIKACFVSQQVFSGNFGEGFRDFVGTESIADSKPGLDEAVLAPRTMVALLEKVRDSHGSVTLDDTVRRFVSGIKGDSDRKVMTSILQGYGFMRRSEGNQ